MADPKRFYGSDQNRSNGQHPNRSTSPHTSASNNHHRLTSGLSNSLANGHSGQPSAAAGLPSKGKLVQSEPTKMAEQSSSPGASSSELTLGTSRSGFTRGEAEVPPNPDDSSKELQEAAAETADDTPQPPVKRKRGRPKGSGRKRVAVIRSRAPTADTTAVDTDPEADTNGSQVSIPKARASRASSKRTYNEDSSENEAPIESSRKGKRRASNAGSTMSRTDDSGEEASGPLFDRRSSLAVSRANSDVDGPSPSRASSLSIRIRRPQLKQSTSTSSETPSRSKKRRIVDSPSDDSLSPPNTSHFAESSTSLQLYGNKTREASASLAVPNDEADGYSSSGTSEVPLLQQAMNRKKVTEAEGTDLQGTLSRMREASPDNESPSIEINAAAEGNEVAVADEDEDIAVNGSAHAGADEDDNDIESAIAKEDKLPSPGRDGTPQLDEDYSRAGTPADTPTHENINPLETEPVRGTGRRRGRGRGRGASAASARQSKRQTPALIDPKALPTTGAGLRGKRAAAAAVSAVTSPTASAAEIAAQERTLRHLEYERQLIAEDRHPLYAEAMAELDNAIATRKQELIRQREARMTSAIMDLEAMERSLWTQWENDKRLLWMEMFHEVVAKDKRLELECKDTNYTALLCPMTSYTQPPIPTPMDVAEIKLEDSDLPTYKASVPFNEKAARHDLWRMQDRDIQKDLELLGLRQADPQRQRSPSPPLLSILPDLPQPVLPPVEKQVPVPTPAAPISSRRSPLPAIAPRPEGHVAEPSVLKPLPLEMPRQAPTARSVPNFRLGRSPKARSPPHSREAHDQMAMRQRQMSGTSVASQSHQYGDGGSGGSKAQPIMLDEEAAPKQQKQPLQPARHIYNRDNYPGEARNIYQTSQQQPPASNLFPPEMYKQASDQGNPSQRDGKPRRAPVEKRQHPDAYYQDPNMGNYPPVQQPPFDPRYQPDPYGYPAHPDYRGYRGKPVYQNAPPSAHPQQGYPPRRTSYGEQFAYDHHPPPPPGLPGYPVYSPPPPQPHPGHTYPRIPGYTQGFSTQPPSYAYPPSHPMPPYDEMSNMPAQPAGTYLPPHPGRSMQYPEGDPRNHPGPPPLATYDHYASYYPPPPPPDAYRRA